MVRPPEAEPVSAARTLVATASDTSGPPSIASTQSRTRAKAGSAATTAPKPTRLATLKAGSTDGIGAGIHALPQRWAGAGPVERDQRHDRRRERHHHRPHAADGGKRGRAPALLGEESSCRGAAARRRSSARLTSDDHDQRQQRARHDGRRVSLCCAVRDLRRIEFAARSSRARAPADRRRRHRRHGRCIVAEALARRVARRPRRVPATTGRNRA